MVEKPPLGGTAKKIWDSLIKNDYQILDLHYNSNCWGRGKTSGWGTWACEVVDLNKKRLFSGEFWCGWDTKSNEAYFEQSCAPYGAWMANVGTFKSLNVSNN